MTDGFQRAIDTDLAGDKATPDYNTDWGVDGRVTFSGGHLREVTAGLKAGILTLSNAPKYFRVELSSGQLVRGGHSAPMFRAADQAHPYRQQSGTPGSKVMTGCGTGPMTDAPSRC